MPVYVQWFTGPPCSCAGLFSLAWLRKPEVSCDPAQSVRPSPLLISSSLLGSAACLAAGAAALGPALGALEAEVGSRLAEGQYLEGGRGQAACGGVAAGADSCCSRAEDMPAPWWAVGKKRAGVPEAAERRRGGGTAARAGHNWVAWVRMRGLQSSSWTAGSGSPPLTCKSCWWT